MTELHYRSISDLATDVKGGSVSPVRLVETLLDRIKRLDKKLLSYVHVAADALDQARRAEKEIRDGAWRGPLHGIPVAIKDNYITAGMPTYVGCPDAELALPEQDARCVSRLIEAGAIILGKLNMHQFAWGNVTPPTTNPWDSARVPGGSSGGAGAAVAAGLCYAALGSDTGGSIRIPASACGTFGIKPTYGRVSKAGIVPHSWSLDHPGPLTRSATDAAIVLEALAGPDADDPATVEVPVPSYSTASERSLSGRRIGVCRNHFFERIDPEVAKAVEEAIDTMARQGARVSEFTVPNLAYGLGAIFVIELASSSSHHDSALKRHLQEKFEADVRTLVEMGKFITAADYLQAERFRRVLARDFARIFDEVDVIATPTMPITAWKLSEDKISLEGQEESVLAASWRLTYPYNLIGVPASSQVCGFHSNGMPIGLQLAAKPFDEVTLFTTAHAYERVTNWNDQHPSL